MKLLTAVNRALTAIPLAAQDQGAMELARKQAAAIDADPEMLKKIGPQLLETLAELGLTPKARSAVMKGGGTVRFDGTGGKLAQFLSQG